MSIIQTTCHMKKLIIIIALLLGATCAWAGIRLPSQIGDYMVLQQQKPIAFFGKGGRQSICPDRPPTIFIHNTA